MVETCLNKKLIDRSKLFPLHFTDQNIHKARTSLPGGLGGFVGGVAGAVGITTRHTKKASLLVH